MPRPDRGPAGGTRTSTGVRFAADLAVHGDRTAIIADGREVTYRALADLVDAMAGRLGSGRRLVLIEAANTLDGVVAYLAALAAGHPALLAPADRPDAVQSLTEVYDPDVVMRAGSDGWEVHERRAGSAHELHPDLALLLSTSGSTGSPKLVRLSASNLQANATAIAEYLRIGPDDRAATTLPMQYCYGLSVLNSHLLRGGSLILTTLSVVDACFWQLFRRHGGTNLAGVPYTFELLDRIGFADLDLPKLRLITQAGGRMAPELVRRYAQLGRRRGWDLCVMYGQTEATARMAYLPPVLAETHPECIGVAIPGGSFSLEDVEPDADGGGDSTGELVYRGPNVMLGYATAPGDLALGATVNRLRTGDLARRRPDGLYEIVGRRSRFAKVLGLRIDLGRIEDHLAGGRVPACCVEADDGILVAVEEPADVDVVARQVARRAGLPPRAVRVVTFSELPRLSNGKPDYAAVRALGADGQRVAEPASAGVVDGSLEQRKDDLVALYAELLARPDATADSTFVSLGGDSLSYVELSVRIEDALGRLPAAWHTRRIADLAAETSPPDRRGRTVEVSVVLRGLAIVLVVATHIGVFSVLGGAHLLLALAGFNVARFHLGAERVCRGLLRGAARVAVPSIAVIAAGQVLTGAIEPRELLLLDSLLQPTSAGRFWFVEVLVYLLAGMTCLLAVPTVRRWQRSFPFGFPVALALAALLTRYEVIGSTAPGMRIYTAHVVFWLFALGWAAAAAVDVRRRAVLTGLVLVTVPGFFDDLSREALVAGGVCAVLWAPSVRLPAWLARSASLLASASLYIYLCHWFVYPHLQAVSGLLALVASLAAGLVGWAVVTRLPRSLRLSKVSHAVACLADEVRRTGRRAVARTSKATASTATSTARATAMTLR